MAADAALFSFLQMGCVNFFQQFPKSVKRFSDKNCGKNKELEQERDSEIAHSALKTNKVECGKDGQL